jgi:hypothetical protein
MSLPSPEPATDLCPEPAKSFQEPRALFFLTITLIPWSQGGKERATYSRNNKCLLQHIIEGNIEGMIEVTGRRGRRHKQLLDDLKVKRGYGN